LKFSLSWLSEHIELLPNTNTEIISNSLTNLGLEVEAVLDSSEQLKGFIIAKIIEITPHPNADKLNICKVEIGDKKLSVVCGASNVRNGLKVVFAPIGVTIPLNGLVLKRKDIRGFTGEGMLCSAEELCLEEKSNGIIELTEDAPVGNIYADWVGLSDPIFEIGLTPNRGDCASVLGIARELASIGLGKLKNNTKEAIKGNYKSPIEWNIKLDSKNKSACPYVVGRHFKGLKNIESPDWLKKRLKSIGLKPISALVDLTNFITFDLGRPLHVFDAQKLSGNLCIRMGISGEKILALDGKNYNLDEKIMMISDSDNAVSIAGVMGGEDSSCDENTTEMFLESAYFNPKNVTTSGRSLNIQSDARYRFERGVDPTFVDEGVNIMTHLVKAICGGEVSELVTAGKINLKKRQVQYSYSEVNKLGGIEVDKNKQDEILKSLGFQIENKGDKANLLIPHWRHDVKDEIDIVEEVIRIYGYDNLKEFPLSYSSNNKNAVLSFDEYRNRLISQALIKRGLYESVTFSFISLKDHQLYSDNDILVELDNPISEDLSIMRQSLLPNLINNFIKNYNKGLNNSGLYEVGPIYLGSGEKEQISCSAGIRSGAVTERHWAIKDREFDIYDSKKDAYKALEAGGINLSSIKLNTTVPKWYHPGRAASITLGKNLLGYFGELHPKYSEIYGMRIMCFELFHNQFPKTNKKKFNKEYVTYSLMPIKRDFAFITDMDIPADDLVKSVKKSLSNLNNIKILNVNLFDVYEKELSVSKQKSLALEVMLQPIEKTLTDIQIKEISNTIVESVKKDTNAILRD